MCSDCRICMEYLRTSGRNMTRCTELNVECDFIWPESEDISAYKVIIVPALYVYSENRRKISCYYKKREK